MSAISAALIAISRQLAAEVDALSFANSAAVHTIYNPLVYARAPHEAYIQRHADAAARIVLVGMNPGPFGMAQTGVPFGDVATVRDFLGVEQPVNPPRKAHPKRPVLGFACPRGEVSGQRVWGWVAARYQRPENFFRHYWIANYCPLVFMSQSGANLTPDKLARDDLRALEAVCDAALQNTVRALGASHLIGIGAFAGRRCAAVAPALGAVAGQILHPSPASPKANRGWASQAEAELQQQGVLR
ncbi:MAG: single-stranded DNA-binding protein [Proteobacteria bacterium]|nr:single-stranded DNA-binding protein [Pseudomonadota bacterium]